MNIPITSTLYSTYLEIIVGKASLDIVLQGVLDYRDLDYRNPPNTGIYKKFQVIRLSGLFTYNSSQYHDPDNRGLGFFFNYRKLFLGLVIPIIEDLL